MSCVAVWCRLLGCVASGVMPRGGVALCVATTVVVHSVSRRHEAPQHSSMELVVAVEEVI